MNRDSCYIEDILGFCDEVGQVVALGEGRYFGTELLPRRAMERCLQNIGEAAGRLSDAAKGTHPRVPWSDIVGLRNVLAHEYGTIDYERLWEIATADVPLLAAHLSR